MVNILFYAKKSSKFFSKNGVIFAFLLVSTVQLAKIDSDNVIVCSEQIGDSKITKKFRVSNSEKVVRRCLQKEIASRLKTIMIR